VLRQQFLNLQAVVLLRVNDDEVVRRLSGRWNCPNTSCGATYHIAKKPPRKPGICDLCGSALTQRIDDQEDTIRERLRIYHQNTEQLISHYRTTHLLKEVDGQGDIESIYSQIAAMVR